MKKRVISLLLVLCTMLYCLPVAANAVEETVETAENCHSMTEQWFGDTPAKRRAVSNLSADLQETVDNYFAVREGDFKDAPAVRKTTISTELSATVQKEAATRAQGIKDFQRRTNIKITDAEVTTFCDNEHILCNEDGTVTVFVYEWTFFDYDDQSDNVAATDVSGHGVYHKITMKEVNGEYQILTDEYDDRDFIGLCTINETTKQELVAMNYEPIDTETSIIEDLKAEASVANAPQTRAASFYSGYNPAKAAEYADQWVYENAKGGDVYEKYYNDAYYNFNPDGGDCANYTSQSIYAGGMPQVVCEPYGTSGWFYKSGDDRSATWTVVRYLRSWMANNRGTLIESANNSNIYMGSPVTYNDAHAVICVGRNSAGTAIINSHNKDWYHGLWNYWSGATYRTVQLTATDPTIDHDTHNYTELHYEADHPHREYKLCFCGAYQYTGTTRKVESCETCYPVYVDTRYSAALPIRGYLIKNQNITPFDSKLMTNTNGGYIDAADECTVTEVYTNGACKVVYPITNGTRTAYIPLSSFLISANTALITATPTKNITTYIRPSTSSTVYGYAAADFLLYKVGTSGSMTQVLYPISAGGYKSGWVLTSELPAAANTYTVTYNANGGSGAPGNQTKTHDVALTLSSTKPTRTGYSFVGWGTSASATTAAYQPGESYTANANITLYAVWKANTYTVTYNANGGSGGPGNQTKTHDVALTLSSTKPTRTGYTFQGWGTSASATTATYQPGGSYAKNESITLYAVWKANTYTISYHANGGTGAPADQTKTYGVTLTLSSKKPTRTGYIFQGWALSANATTVKYAAGASYTENAGATLYAVWKVSTYTVSYDANGGSGAPGNQTKTYGVDLTLSTVEPKRSGYDFLGWSEIANATMATYQPGGTYTGNSNLHLYAIWKPLEYKVTYYANGGVGAPTQQTKLHDVPLTLSSAKPSRTGYTFQGWGLSANATTVKYEAGATYTDNANVSLYAIWKANTYTVSYNANGGTGAPAAQTKTHGVPLTLSSQKPTREGYAFQGWGTSASATTVKYAAGASYTADAGITLYAVWKANEYTVTYNANGGNNPPANQTKVYGVDLKLSTTEPTRPGYKFLGWSTSATATTATYQPGATYKENKAITLYAVWRSMLKPAVQVGTASAKAGEQVTVDVSISNNPGISQVTFGFNYDTSRLKLVNAEANSAVGGTVTFDKEKEIFLWVSRRDSTYNGVFLTLTFDVLANAATGDASVEVTCSEGDIRNTALEEINVTIKTGKVSVTAVAPKQTFIDVPPSAWYYREVELAAEEGYVQGVGNGYFKPDMPINRAMLVTLLWRYAGEPKGYTNVFTDVPAGQWYTEAIAWAAYEGIVQGIGQNRFDPNGLLSREQMATLFYRYTKETGGNIQKTTDLRIYPDNGSINSWSREAMAWAVAEGLVGGSSVNGLLYLKPQGEATRAQLAVIFVRYVENIEG